MIVGYSRRFGIGGNDSFTKLLLHCDGTDGSTSFPDSSSSAHTVTAGGNAQIDTAQFKFGTGSFLGDGSDYLSLDGSADFTFGTGDFTIDFWVRLASGGAIQTLYDGRPSGSGGGPGYPAIYVSTDNTVRFYQNGDRITGTTALSTGGVWYHVALARSGTSTKLFLNGTQEGSTLSDSTNYLGGSAGRPFLGGNSEAPGSFSLNGWMDEIRVSKGIARWTANFTPPSQPYS